jgi:ATP-dependent DNA helicase RecQ
LQAVTDALVSKDKSASPVELSHDTGLSQRKVINIVHKLEEVGAAAKLTSGEIQLVQKKTPAQMIEAASEQQKALKDLRSHRLQQMQQYAEGRSCRRAFLLRYFGDDFEGNCGNCDRCEAMGGIAIAR